MPVTLSSVVPVTAAAASLLLAGASLLRRSRSPATWCFAGGMTALGLDSLLTGLALRGDAPAEMARWLTWAFVVQAAVPLPWLAFSLVFSRGDWRTFLARWRIPLAVAALLPLVAFAFRGQLLELVASGTPDGPWLLRFGAPGKALHVVLLVALALILTNLEQTFRAAVGTMRWRIKFVVLGLAVVFGARLYVRSQAIVYSAITPELWAIDSSGLLVGCLLLGMAYLRTGLAEIDVYPSLAVLRSSLTVLLVGGYLFVVGVLAQVVSRVGGTERFQVQAFVVLLGAAGLAVLLLSDRLRQWIHGFVARHFRKAQHDSARTWTLFSQRLANVTDQAGLCAAAARSISETFEALSVSVWVPDEPREQLVLGASTARPPTGAAEDVQPEAASPEVLAGLRERASPFDLEAAPEPWADELRRLNPTTFANGGRRLCVPLRAGDDVLGAVVLADRVNGAPYTVEDLELLRCIGDQVTSVLVNLRLANEVARARELEAFRTMSAFFVHDLKNAAASLNLMLRNLPVHFDDPAFREDALRGIAGTARRIDQMIARLGALRQQPDFVPEEADLNALVAETLDRLDAAPGVELVRDFRPVPPIVADREQLRAVVTNLVVNARDAVDGAGRVEVRTDRRGDRVVLSVADDGCGMTAAFVRDSLFRPFQSTKPNGLGIGMFQSRMIVERHGGSLQVESAPGRGTTFRASFPARSETR